MKNNSSNPWTEEFPFRNIKTNEFNGNIVYDYNKKLMILRNNSGNIDIESKYWSLVKVLKSATSVCHWLIKMHKRFFVVAQSRMSMYGDVCSVYESDSKGKYDSANPCAIYMQYLDIESAADRFSQEYMAYLINTNHPDVSFLNTLEIHE